MELVNPFAQQGRWFKANLHTHTTVSDGDSTIAERLEQYKGKGYSVLAITDHYVAGDVDGLGDDDFLVISGYEAHPDHPSGATRYHLVCLNVPGDFALDESLSVQGCIDKTNQAGGKCIIGHPYWCGFNINDLLPLEGHIGIEVYNRTCDNPGKGISSVQWDDMLLAGEMIGAVAVDDTHRSRDLFGGWTMIKAKELTAAAVMESLQKGCCYSSCGPVIEDFRIENGIATLKCSLVREIFFMAERSSGASFRRDSDKVLTSAQWEVKVNPAAPYVRAEVVDDKGKRAWTNPIVLPSE